MRSSPRFIRDRVARPAARQAFTVLTALLPLTFGAGCGRSLIFTAIAPRVTPSSDTLGVRSAMTPVKTLPVLLDSETVPRPRTIRWRHSYAGATIPLPPMLMLIDGIPLGLRSDSSVDHTAAKRLMQQIRCKDFVSIKVVKGEEALRRFGRAADAGVILITTASHTWRAAAGNP
jgi:hypothetical protein